MTLRPLAAVLLLSTLAACGPVDAGDVDTNADDLGDGKEDSAANPLKMPKAITDWEHAQGWGDHHLQWHIERRWNLLGASDRTWASKKGWTKSTLQEGA